MTRFVFFAAGLCECGIEICLQLRIRNRVGFDEVIKVGADQYGLTSHIHLRGDGTFFVHAFFAGSLGKNFTIDQLITNRIGDFR